MKTLIKILVLVGIIFLSFHCVRSTQGKIIQGIKSNSYYDDVKIDSVQVLDTIFQSEIDLIMKSDSLMLVSLRIKFKDFETEIANTRKGPRPDFRDTVKIQHFKSLFDSARHYDREISMIDNRYDKYDKITDVNYYNYVDYRNDIRGYRVRIYNRNGRVNEFIIKQDYSMLCPTFIIDPPDSIPDFRFDRPRPNETERKRPPRFERSGKNLPRVVK